MPGLQAVLDDRINAQSCSYNFARHEGMWGNAGMASLIINLVLDGSEWLASRSGRFTSEKSALYTL
jgi:hypothetical protein